MVNVFERYLLFCRWKWCHLFGPPCCRSAIHVDTATKRIAATHRQEQVLGARDDVTFINWSQHARGLTSHSPRLNQANWVVWAFVQGSTFEPLESRSCSGIWSSLTGPSTPSTGRSRMVPGKKLGGFFFTWEINKTPSFALHIND